MVNRGFGFVRESETDSEFVFHWEELSAGSLDQLREGQTIEFDTESDPREEGRMRAVNVRLTGQGSDQNATGKGGLNMAGGNKSNSPKTKKRNIQRQAQEVKRAADKRRTYRGPTDRAS